MHDVFGGKSSQQCRDSATEVDRWTGGQADGLTANGTHLPTALCAALSPFLSVHQSTCPPVDRAVQTAYQPPNNPPRTFVMFIS